MTDAMKFTKNHYWIFIVALIFVLDRITKTLVLQYLPFGLPVNVLPTLNLFFIFNTGSAFGFLNQAGGWQEWLFSGIAIIVSCFLIIWQFKVNVKYVWFDFHHECRNMKWENLSKLNS